MKTIIILGSNGEIGNFLSENLSDSYIVLNANRNKKDQNYFKHILIDLDWQIYF